MATFTGILAENAGSYIDSDGPLSVDDPAFNSPSVNFSELDTLVGIKQNTFQNKADVSVTYSNTGRAGSYYEIFWNKIHLIPDPLDVGIILGSTDYSVLVWNTFEQTINTLSSITPTTAEGITNDSSPPEVFGPQEIVFHTYTISVTGPASIDASFDYNFSSDFGDTILNITGARSIIWPFPPQGNLSVTYQFKTSINTSIDQDEQRICVRDLPRLIYTAKYLLPSREFIRRWHSIMSSWGATPLAVPIWTDSSRLVDSLLPGATVLTFDTTNIDWKDFVFLFDAVTLVYEVSQIASVAAGSITLQSGISNTYGIDTYVMPAKSGLLSQQQSFGEYPSKTVTGPVAIEITDLTDISTTFDNDFNNLAVMEDPHLINGTRRLNIRHNFQRLDSGRGLFTFQNVADASNYTFDFLKEIVQDRAAAFAFKQFLSTTKGRYKTFYMPTMRDDFILTDTIGGGTNELFVENEEYRNLEFLDKVFMFLRIEKNDGSIFYNEITNAETEAGDKEKLTCVDNFPSEILVIDTKLISLMCLARFDTDSFVLNYARLNEVIFRAPIKGVKV